MRPEKKKNEKENTVSETRLIAVVALSAFILIVSIVSTFSIGSAIQAMPTPTTFADGYHQSAAEALYAREYHEAIRLLTDAIALDADDGRYYGSRALAYFQIERYEMALRDYSRAIDLDSSTPSRYAERAYLYHVMERYDKALIDYTVALALDNTQTRVYRQRGDTCIQLGDYQCALDDYTRTLSMLENVITDDMPLDDVTYMKTLKSRAYAYALRGTADNNTTDYTLAIKDYYLLLELHPESLIYRENLSVIYNNRGNIRLEKGDTEGAAADYLEATQLDPDFAIPWWSLAGIYDASGDISSAIHYYQQYTSLADDDLSVSAENRIDDLQRHTGQNR
ncbi:MAG: tetratricopeptide repeat protein [Aggregatilineales bacterium]